MSTISKVRQFLQICEKTVFEFEASCARATAKIGQKD
jgi:hypothetical protein